MIGKQVGNYRILLEAGEDNLGLLYQAEHAAGAFGATVRHFAAQFTDVQLVARYLEIARAASALGHPGIWNVRETVWSGRNVILAGEALPRGETLDVILKRDHRLWPELVVKLGWQMAVALGAAHATSIFHCRLDGDSVYIFQDPQAPGGYRTKVMDFGVSAFLDTGSPDWRSPRVEAFGLPFYMAPEQCRAGIADFRSDVYSLGCLLYHMAAGQPPFVGQTQQEIASAHQMAPVAATLQQFDASIPFELDQLVGQTLSKDPAARPTMPQIGFELERIAKKYWTTPTVERTVQLDLRIGAPPPAAARVAEPPAKRSRLVPVVAVILGLGGAGAAVAILQPWKKKNVAAATTENTTPDAAVAAAPEPAAKPVPAPAPAPAAKPAPSPAPAPAHAEPPAPPPESEAEKQLGLARAALKEERWHDATVAAEAAHKLEPKNPDVESVRKAARSEPRNQKLWESFNKAAADNDPGESAKRLARIPETSMYYPRAQETFERVKRDYLHVKMAEAKALAETRMCAKIAPIEKEVKRFFPDSVKEIEAIAQACKPR